MKYDIYIPKDVNELIHILKKNGYSAYIVGGCVRDSILGRIPHDWDICTSATPSQMLEIFKGRKIIETGLQHGTVTVVVNGKPYEITTYRIDGVYSDNRRPDSVTFTNDLIEDLKRRDFTINAMAYNDEEGLIDPFGGLKDIKNGKIQCVGSAKERFEEDALRILRAIRFSAQLSFSIDIDTDSQIHKQYESLKNISIERITSEFCKIAVSEYFWIDLLLYRDVFSLFIPELKPMFDFPQNNPIWHVYNAYEHTVHAIEHCDSNDLIVRLAVLFHDIGKPHVYQDDEYGIRHFVGHGKISADITDSIMKRLRFDNETRKNVVELVYYHDSTLNANKKSVKRWLNKIDKDQFLRLLQVKRADNNSQNLKMSSNRILELIEIEYLVEDILDNEECFSLKDMEINGKDLLNIGFKSGKELGNTLNTLLQLVIDGKCENNKESLLEEAEKILLSM